MRVSVWASSETERNPERKLRWGDYWLKLRLEQELERQGWTVDAEVKPGTDVFIHCFGGHAISNLPAHTYNVLYIHSHPAMLKGMDFGMYDRVVAGSEKLAARLGEQGIAATWNIGATDFKPLDVPLTHDAVFVGNAREGFMMEADNDVVWSSAGTEGRKVRRRFLSRPIIQALGDLTTLPFKLEIWGEGWNWLPKGIWQGPFIHNDELNALYSGSAVVLNDTHADMVEAGIINPRVLDAQAAGAFVADPRNGGERDRIAEAVRMRRNGLDPVPPLPGENGYSRLVTDLVGNIAPRLRVDLGCGNHKREGFVGIDRVAAEGVDIVWDVRCGLPVTSGIDYAVADNLLEHIGPEFIDVMNGAHNAIRHGGRFTVITPGTHMPLAAFSDPTHVRYFTPETWDYFDVASERWRDYGQSYGILPWRVLRREVRDRFIDVVLTPVTQPVKECEG